MTDGEMYFPDVESVSSETEGMLHGLLSREETRERWTSLRPRLVVGALVAIGLIVLVGRYSSPMKANRAVDSKIGLDQTDDIWASVLGGQALEELKEEEAEAAPMDQPIPAPVPSPSPKPVQVPRPITFQPAPSQAPVPEPVPQPIIEPYFEPSPPPAPAPVPQPIVEPYYEPSPPPAPAPVPQPVIEPYFEPSPPPAPAPVPQPIVEPYFEPSPPPAPAPVPQPIIEPYFEPSPPPAPAPVPQPSPPPAPAPVPQPIIQPYVAPPPAPVPVPVPATGAVPPASGNLLALAKEFKDQAAQTDSMDPESASMMNIAQILENAATKLQVAPSQSVEAPAPPPDVSAKDSPLAPREDMRDGNRCADDEEEVPKFSGLCYKRCDLLTGSRFPIRNSPFSCCSSHPCTLNKMKINMALCAGFDVAGDSEGNRCPHTEGTCLVDEELFDGLCYKKCNLLAGKQFWHRVAPTSCCDTTGVRCLLPSHLKSNVAFAMGGGGGDGNSKTPSIPHPPLPELTEFPSVAR